MADVSERAQVLLMAALGMAIMFVALALILNTAIYTENLATRGSEVAGGGEAIRFLQTANEGIGGSIEYVNRHNDTSHDALQRNLSRAVPGWSEASARHFSHRGRSVDVRLDGTGNGTRIVQQNDSRNFTSLGGDETWVLADDVNGTRDLRFEVHSASEPFGSDDAFEVNVSDGAAYWRMNVTDDGNGVNVSVRNGTGGEFTCTTSSSPVWVNVSAGTLDGEDCDGLSFGEGVQTPYEISFDNADNVTGTYSLVVHDDGTVADNPGLVLSDNDVRDDPFAAPAIYSANLTVVYQTPRLYYNASTRVVPGESDD